jgi:hypothetical protein
LRKAIRTLILTLLTIWVVTAVAYRLWQRHTGRRVAGVPVAHHVKPPAKPTAAAPDATTRLLAGIACGRAITTDGQTLACPVCPQGSDDGPQDGSTPEPGPGLGWTYESTLPGHFTSPTADEALLHITGCESHASNLGGDFLLRAEAGHWSLIRYIHGGVARAGCQTLPWPAGPGGSGDAVLCQTADMNQGVVSDRLELSRYPEAAPGESPTGGSSQFLAVVDESANCDPDTPDHSDPVEVASIRHWRLLPAATDSSDPRRDLEIQVDLEQRRHKKPDGCTAGAVDHLTLRFRNMGDHFQAADGVTAFRALQGRRDPTVPEQVRPEVF